jgi:hypothetical protein
LKGVHLLLTYTCNRACDHCFVYGGPEAHGTFTLQQVRQVLDQLPAVGTIETVCFEGGEPFLFYPIMLEGIRLARGMGFNAGVVTNAYWALSEQDAEVWLKPLRESGLAAVSISDDSLHYGDERDLRARNVQSAAAGLGMTVSVLRTERPSVTVNERGEQVIAGGVMFRGRAAEKFAAGLPTQPSEAFTKCPFEDLRNPGRVHVDAYGNVHLCQGLLMGNVWDRPMAELVKGYEPDTHPLVGPLLRGGPAALAEQYGAARGAECVSACHLCYLVRRALLDGFPQFLAPRQVYGL